MALPSSGPISLLDLQNEFGGNTPISLSEYYRDPTRTTGFLLNNGLNQDATTSPHNSYRNGTISSVDTISLGQFTGYPGRGGAAEYKSFSMNFSGFSSDPLTWPVLSGNRRELVQIFPIPWNPADSTQWRWNLYLRSTISITIRGWRQGEDYGDDNGWWVSTPSLYWAACELDGSDVQPENLITTTTDLVDGTPLTLTYNAQAYYDFNYKPAIRLAHQLDVIPFPTTRGVPLYTITNWTFGFGVD